ncbi:MAG: hypothetical protein B7Z73_19855 [Planctomycetia bacterium 21-64-5]|nr:MAG: hypothetical protein B7Z73_19855 [Planctomycetia bacterium 21-64-5]HVA45219.1 hypothetical protein [Pirellulales bacterium]
MNGCVSLRRELLAAVEEISLIRPDWRLGQLVANLATTAGRLDAGAVWELDDTEALAAAKVLIEQHRSAAAAEIAEPAAMRGGRGT